MSRDGAVPSHEAGYQLGQGGGAVAGLQGRQMPQKEAHGGVQMLLCHHPHDDEGFPRHKHHAGHEREEEDSCLRAGNIPHSIGMRDSMTAPLPFLCGGFLVLHLLSNFVGNLQGRSFGLVFIAWVSNRQVPASTFILYN